jgi:hypothetical protein
MPAWQSWDGPKPSLPGPPTDQACPPQVPILMTPPPPPFPPPPLSATKLSMEDRRRGGSQLRSPPRECSALDRTGLGKGVQWALQPPSEVLLGGAKSRPLGT